MKEKQDNASHVLPHTYTCIYGKRQKEEERERIKEPMHPYLEPQCTNPITTK